MADRVLIADDNEINITILRGILEKKSFKIIEATNGIQAYEEIQKELPDLILLDIMMPGMDGFEVARLVKKNPKLKHIPILFISALDDKENIIKGFEHGGQDYVSKPFNKDELLARIRTHLQLKHLNENLQIKAEENQRLLHVLTHDLANPLQAILSTGEVMKLVFNTQNEKFQKYLKNINDMAINMQQLIGYIREMLAIESGKARFSVKKVSLRDILNKTEAIFANRLEAKRINLMYDFEGSSEDYFISIEPISFQNSVIGNILSNCIKFSYPDSKIDIKISRKGDFVEIAFIDYGVGIKKHNLKSIFSTSKSTSTQGTLGERGTGFGMPLVKKYIKKYGGDIFISSKHVEEYPQEHGTTIQILVPNFKPSLDE